MLMMLMIGCLVSVLVVLVVGALLVGLIVLMNSDEHDRVSPARQGWIDRRSEKDQEEK